MQYHQKKKQTNKQANKKATGVKESLSKNAWKYMKLKIPRPATKEDKNSLFLHDGKATRR